MSKKGDVEIAKVAAGERTAVARFDFLKKAAKYSFMSLCAVLVYKFAVQALDSKVDNVKLVTGALQAIVAVVESTINPMSVCASFFFGVAVGVSFSGLSCFRKN